MVYAIVPARSGSKGLPDKNVRVIAGKELLAYSISFALSLNLDRVICSTDSERYAEIARRHGAEVPFLRSAEAALDSSMEEHILQDLYRGFDAHQLPYPDVFVWLRPTFVFRDGRAVKMCIRRLLEEPATSACRVVTEAESRLYRAEGEYLTPAFRVNGRSMIRRQEMEPRYRVFNTDVFRGKPKNSGPNFLGDSVKFSTVHKLCGLDIDDEWDLQVVASLIERSPELVREYLL